MSYKKKDWARIDRKAVDSLAVKMQEQGGFNMQAWNKVMGLQLMPNIDIQRDNFRKYQNL